MLMRYLKAQGFVLLCGGLVGPIFLATFFALGEEPILKWMFWVGLLITAADVLIALALTNYGAKSAAKTQFLEHQGVLALAQVTAISETGTRINDQPLVKINLHIEGPGLTPIRRSGPGDRLGDPAADDHRAQAGRARRSGHQQVPDRLGEKRSGQRSGSGAVHPRRGQPDLRPVRAGRPADGDHADPQGQQHPDERHHRHPVQSCCASAGDGRGAARGGSARHPLRPRPPFSHHRHRRPPSACRNSRRCGPPARFRRPSTPPSASRSSPPCSRTAIDAA